MPETDHETYLIARYRQIMTDRSAFAKELRKQNKDDILCFVLRNHRVFDARGLSKADLIDCALDVRHPLSRHLVRELEEIVYWRWLESLSHDLDGVPTEELARRFQAERPDAPLPERSGLVLTLTVIEAGGRTRPSISSLLEDVHA